MRIKHLFKPVILFLSVFVLSLGACQNGNNNSKKNNEFMDAMPEPIYYQKEDEYIFYTDDYFKHRSIYYNEHLATLSMQMAKYSMNKGGPDSLDDTSWYEEQSDRLHTFFDLIGFDNFAVNKDYKARTGFNTIGIAASTRKIKEQDHEFTVIACTVRSGGYFLEWENNVYLGDGSKSDMMHEGWYNAANKVDDFLKDYIKKYQLTGWIKIWMSGYSRGGAIINLAGGFLDNRIDKNGRDKVYDGVSLKHDDLLVYTFEAPQGANVNAKTVKTPKDPLYNNIFNIVNPNDIVPKVAMSDWGFQRFGIDKFITTEFFDADRFETNRNTTKKLYALTNPNKSWKCDNLTSYNLNEVALLADISSLAILIIDLIDTIIDVASGDLPDFIYEDDKKANYDTNIVATLILEQAMVTMADKDSSHDGRKYYHNNLEGALRKVMLKLFNDVEDPNLPTDITTAIKLLFQFILYCVVGNTGYFFDLKEVFGFTDAEEDSVYAIIEGIFDEYPGELLTLGLNVTTFDQNHETNVNLAHIQAQDSFWIEHYKHTKGETLNKVPLRSNAEFFYVDNIDLNEMDVRNANQNDKRVIGLWGSEREASKIEVCDKGYALGYYHYATYERSKAFMPAYYDYKVGAYSHSDDIWHRVACYIWHYTSNNTDIIYRKSKKVVDEYYNCDADYFRAEVKKTVQPE